MPGTGARTPRPRRCRPGPAGSVNASDARPHDGRDHEREHDDTQRPRTTPDQGVNGGSLTRWGRRRWGRVGVSFSPRTVTGGMGGRGRTAGVHPAPPEGRDRTADGARTTTRTTALHRTRRRDRQDACRNLSGLRRGGPGEVAHRLGRPVTGPSEARSRGAGGSAGLLPTGISLCPLTVPVLAAPPGGRRPAPGFLGGQDLRKGVGACGRGGRSPYRPWRW
jgi:hypothetical protein